MDNSKIAARYFLNAIDRVDALKEKYQKNLQELEQNISMLQQIISKPFEKEIVLAQLKTGVSNLEREISIKIQANQMQQHNQAENIDVEINETHIIKMQTKETKIDDNITLVEKNNWDAYSGYYECVDCNHPGRPSDCCGSRSD